MWKAMGFLRVRRKSGTGGCLTRVDFSLALEVYGCVLHTTLYLVLRMTYLAYTLSGIRSLEYDSGGPAAYELNHRTQFAVPHPALSCGSFGPRLHISIKHSTSDFPYPQEPVSNSGVGPGLTDLSIWFLKTKARKLLFDPTWTTYLSPPTPLPWVAWVLAPSQLHPTAVAGLHNLYAPVSCRTRVAR